MKGQGRPHPAASFPYGEPGRCHPVLPLHVGQGGRHGSVRWQPDRDRDVAQFAVAAGDVAQAVRRIREAVQKNDGPDRRAVRLENVRPVPVLHEVARIDRTSVEVSITGNASFRIQSGHDLGLHGLEHPRLGLEVGGPVCLVEFRRRQFMRHVCMPKFEPRPALGIVGTHREEREGTHRDQGESALREFEQSCRHSVQGV